MTNKGKSMAKTTETPRKKRKAGEMAVWLLMALLILGLGGFGIENFTGGSSAVARVGSREITVDDYARQMQQQLNQISQQYGQNFTMEQARAMGLDREVLGGLIELTTQDSEADRLGLSVGDAVVATSITKINAFKDAAGKFDRNTYAFVLRQNNLTEPRFEQQLRDDTARQLLTGAVRGGFVPPAALTDTLYNWMGERRAVSILRLAEVDLPAPVAQPTEDELHTWYQANIDRFTRPAAKSIAYAEISPADLEGKVTVDEAAARALYDQHLDQYAQPERRLVERLVFPDEATAAQAKARIDAGTPFADVVKDRGLSLEDIDMGDVSRADLGPAADAVFALTEPGVTGPVQSSLGPALFRVNGILAAQETPFDEVRPQLETEVRAIEARKQVDALVNTVDDALAGGASIEDLAREQGMRQGSFAYAPGADDNDPVAASQAFRTAADAAQNGDFPESLRLEDGSLVAFEVRGTVDPSPRPFDTVRDKVAAAWHAEAVAKALAARAAEIKAGVDAGAALESFGSVQVSTELPREGRIDGAPEDTMSRIFKLPQGELTVLQDADYTALVRVDRVIPAASAGSDSDALKSAIRAQIEQGLAEDALTLWTSALTQDAGITIDQKTIDAINAQFN